MLKMKSGELQIKYDRVKGRIYVRIIRKSERVDIVATSEHKSRANEILGKATGRDAKGYPLWMNVSTCNLARLIEKDVELSH